MLLLLCFCMGTCFGVMLGAVLSAGAQADAQSERHYAPMKYARKNAHSRYEL